MNNLNKKLSGLASDQPSDWKAKAKYRRENREWLKKSAAIAVLVLDALHTQNLSQKGLAEKMNISPQQISKIIKGHENLTLETISNLEIALGIQIIEDNAHYGRSCLKRKNRQLSTFPYNHHLTHLPLAPPPPPAPTPHPN